LPPGGGAGGPPSRGSVSIARVAAPETSDLGRSATHPAVAQQSRLVAVGSASRPLGRDRTTFRATSGKGAGVWRGLGLGQVCLTLRDKVSGSGPNSPQILSHPRFFSELLERFQIFSTPPFFAVKQKCKDDPMGETGVRPTQTEARGQKFFWSFGIFLLRVFLLVILRTHQARNSMLRGAYFDNKRVSANTE